MMMTSVGYTLVGYFILVSSEDFAVRDGITKYLTYSPRGYVVACAFEGSRNPEVRLRGQLILSKWQGMYVGLRVPGTCHDVRVSNVELGTKQLFGGSTEVVVEVYVAYVTVGLFPDDPEFEFKKARMHTYEFLNLLRTLRERNKEQSK